MTKSVIDTVHIKAKSIIGYLVYERWSVDHHYSSINRLINIKQTLQLNQERPCFLLQLQCSKGEPGLNQRPFGSKAIAFDPSAVPFYHINIIHLADHMNIGSQSFAISRHPKRYTQSKMDFPNIYGRNSVQKFLFLFKKRKICHYTKGIMYTSILSCYIHE